MEGRTRSWKLKTGRYKNVSNLVKTLSLWEAGLSALENDGSCPPRQTARKLKIMITLSRSLTALCHLSLTLRLVSSKSQSRQIAKTVTPCSLANIASVANKGVANVHPFCRCLIRVRRQNMVQRISARPTTPDTASL